MERILVIEDDSAIKTELITLLNSNGYRAVDEMPCDLALLDVSLPEKSGFDICREIRKKSDIPVIFLTARDSSEDELIGFGVGADDYIKKPYNSSVLLARIARLLSHKQNTVITARELTLDLSVMVVSYKGITETLTKNEARILNFLMKKDICPKDEIIENLWQNSLYIDENTLYVNINRLREKLKKLGAENYLTTVRGVGYRL